LGLRHARTAAKTPTTNPPAEYATTWSHRAPRPQHPHRPGDHRPAGVAAYAEAPPL